jgi:hypothetical protein
MPVTDQTFVNLIALAEALKKDARYKRLKPTLLTALKAQSCLADLQLAQLCSDALDRVEPDTKEVNLGDLTIWNALLQQGIMLYVRATFTGSKLQERGAIKLDIEKLTSDARFDHELLVHHRNKVLSHVQSNDDVWHNQIVYLVGNKLGWTYSATTARLHVDGDLCGVLRRQIPVAVSIVNESARKSFGKVMVLLGQGGFPVEDWWPHKVDHISLFGSEAAAAKVAAKAFAGGMPDIRFEISNGPG